MNARYLPTRWRWLFTWCPGHSRHLLVTSAITFPAYTHTWATAYICCNNRLHTNCFPASFSFGEDWTHSYPPRFCNLLSAFANCHLLTKYLSCTYLRSRFFPSWTYPCFSCYLLPRRCPPYSNYTMCTDHVRCYKFHFACVTINIMLLSYHQEFIIPLNSWYHISTILS